MTQSQAFEVSLKTTCNQSTRKKVSDFKNVSRKVAPNYYRWHNKSGRGSLWATDFESSLRYTQ